MTFQLVCIEPKELTQYKSDMQEAFQKGFEDVFGKTDAVILPEKDIDQSLNAEGSAVYKAVVDGEMVGGAVVIINESTQHNHLDLLFVKNGVQSNGIGKKIWFELERIYPNTKVYPCKRKKLRKGIRGLGSGRIFDRIIYSLSIKKRSRRNCSARETIRRKSMKSEMPLLACVKNGRPFLQTLLQGRDCRTR